MHGMKKQDWSMWINYIILFLCFYWIIKEALLLKANLPFSLQTWGRQQSGRKQVEAKIQSACHNIYLWIWQIDLSLLLPSVFFPFFFLWTGSRAIIEETNSSYKGGMKLQMTDDLQAEKKARFHQEDAHSISNLVQNNYTVDCCQQEQHGSQFTIWDTIAAIIFLKEFYLYIHLS